MRGEDTHTNTVCACGLTHNTEARRARSNPESGMAKCTAALPGGRARTHLHPAKTIRGLPTKDDRSTRRAHPPSPARRCEPEGLTSAGNGSPTMSVHIRIQSQSRRTESARETRKEKAAGRGGRGAREAKPVKNKPLGEVHGRPGRKRRKSKMS
jgi:hypothetical protein